MEGSQEIKEYGKLIGKSINEYPRRRNTINRTFEILWSYCEREVKIDEEIVTRINKESILCRVLF